MSAFKSLGSYAKRFALCLSDRQVAARSAVPDLLRGHVVRCRMMATQAQRGVFGI
jgi:hypothetical protein